MAPFEEMEDVAEAVLTAINLYRKGRPCEAVNEMMAFFTGEETEQIMEALEALANGE